MECPACGLLNPPSAQWCDCGYDFLTKRRQLATSGSEKFAGGTEPRIRRLAFHGSGGSLFGIYLTNVFLTIITLGIYYFWSKVKVRRYLQNQTEFEGDRFAYHGTGKELLIGSLKAVVVFGVPFIFLKIVSDLSDLGPVITVGAAALAYGILLVLIPFAMAGARRYRLSRTSWRGIRFSFRGRTADFIKLYLGNLLLTVVTLGLWYPMFTTKKQAFMVSHTYFGSQKFHFDGMGRDLFGSYVRALLLTIPTLGLCWFWFLARKHRYLWDHTGFAGARFRSTVAGGTILRLKLGNLLLQMLTLGLAWPWVATRNLRLAFAYLTLGGPLDLAAIQQEAQAASATGEGLASFLDAGFDLG